MREIMYLLDGGVPWEVATRITPTRRLAMVVARGELRGGTYDWATLRWVKKQ